VRIGLVAIAMGILFSVCIPVDPPREASLGNFQVIEAGYYSITSQELMDAITFLASPERGGRRNGTGANISAGNYLIKELENAGSDFISTAAFQPFRFNEVRKPTVTIKQLEASRAKGYSIALEGRNVFAILEGSTYKNEYVVLGAHYDHLGTQHGKLYPGADDNASGSAAIVEIAEAFGALSQKGMRPERSVVFAFFDAEEWGLWGSQYFVENPPVPLNQIVAVINLDVVGRNNTQELEVFGSPDINDFAQRSPQLNGALNDANGVLGFKLLFPEEKGGREQIFFRSDHASFFFARSEGNRIPVVFLTSGLHNDYHKPSDTAKKINSEKAQNIARLAFLMAWQVATQDEQPVFVEK